VSGSPHLTIQPDRENLFQWHISTTWSGPREKPAIRFFGGNTMQHEMRSHIPLLAAGNEDYNLGMLASVVANSPFSNRSFSLATQGMVGAFRSTHKGMGVRMPFLSRSVNSTTISSRE